MGRERSRYWRSRRGNRRVSYARRAPPRTPCARSPPPRRVRSSVPVTDAAATAMEVLRGRAAAAKVTPVSLKSLLDGTIDVVMHGVRSRDEVVRVQALFSARGAVDLRVLVPDPAKGPVS